MKLKISQYLNVTEPFRIKSFRFQWPADLLTSWGFEMEALILGWYILSTTGSVLLLTAFGSLRFIGTLLSPWFGVASDRWGSRRMMFIMRFLVLFFALCITLFEYFDMLSTNMAFALAALSGLVQPSEIVVRNALIGDTIPQNLFMKATSFSRISHDSARIFGALVGAGLFSWLGLGIAYIFVVTVYIISLALTFGVSRAHPRADRPFQKEKSKSTPSLYSELREGISYIKNSGPVLAIICLAFLANLTAFPVTHGLMPYIAKNVMSLDENGLGQLLAVFSCGAVLGSLILAVTQSQKHASKLMLINLILWYITLAIFAFTETKIDGLIALFFVGLAHSFAMTSMSVALLGFTDELVRGRVMGVRVLAVYGVPIGLLASGFLIDYLGYSIFMAMYIFIGITVTVIISIKWRYSIWYSQKT
jgi:predicted MFS family arabinose efflux permease